MPINSVGLAICYDFQSPFLMGIKETDQVIKKQISYVECQQVASHVPPLYIISNMHDFFLYKVHQRNKYYVNCSQTNTYVMPAALYHYVDFLISTCLQVGVAL